MLVSGDIGTGVLRVEEFRYYQVICMYAKARTARGFCLKEPYVSRHCGTIDEEDRDEILETVP